MYDVYPIEMVEQVGTMTTSTTDEKIPQNTDSVKQNSDKLFSGRNPGSFSDHLFLTNVLENDTRNIEYYAVSSVIEEK